MSNEKHVYIEEKRLVNESTCKFMKRLIVGFIRHFESENQETNIPEIYFDDVPDNLGFDYEILDSESGDPLRCFTLKYDWKPGISDCGGDEEDINDLTFSVPKTKEIRKKHLKLII